MVSKETVNKRQTNIELLRIISMLGIIVLHYNNSDMGGGFLHALGLNRIILMFLESIFICGVNLYVLISGYFLGERKERKVLRVVELLVQVMIFQVGFYGVGVVLGQNTLSISGLLRSLVPANYFAILYVVTFLISPYINVLLERLGQKQSLILMGLLLMLFSVWPTLVDLLKEWTGLPWSGLSSIGIGGSQQGYTIVNFLLMYSIGAYLKLYYKKEQKMTKLLIALLVVVVLIWGWSLGNDLSGIVGGSAWEYCNPLIIAEAVLLFLVFKEWNLKHIPAVNGLAKAGFTVYLMHTGFLPFIKIPAAVKGNTLVMLVHLVVSVVAIYLICFVCYVIYEKVTRPVFRLIDKKWDSTLGVE